MMMGLLFLETQEEMPLTSPSVAPLPSSEKYRCQHTRAHSSLFPASPTGLYSVTTSVSATWTVEFFDSGRRCHQRISPKGRQHERGGGTVQTHWCA